ncbi:kelch-like protein 17 [Gigaspora margarita]|uniref:Kelch-like protein 17 n=1 Tax=Gigaspora margarita TaxID=4874 RepID=A0A8H4B4J6_GIGMA|nr:kelch-like protein 17 [Gigaspora margarita]
MYEYLTPHADPLIEWLNRAISEQHINFFNYEKFTEISLINNGGFGTIKKALWNQTKLTVALKSIKSDIKIDDKIINDFIKELKTLQKVSFHPNVIQFYGVTKDPKTGLGVILWEISSGKPPFESNTAYQSIIQINNGIRETPVEGTPSQYVDLYERCWAEDPNERPDAESVLETINRIKNPKINSDLINLEDSRELISHIDPLLKDIDVFLIPDKLRLIHRASDDGFGKKIFFKNTKNIERSILILHIRDTNEIIGGYNPLAWRELKGFGSVDSCYETCNNFIFSLKRGNLENSIFSKVKCPKRAIYREKGLGPAFSLDLFMVSDKKGGKTWGCFKSDYERPIRHADEYFQIEDYEVFQYL